MNRLLLVIVCFCLGASAVTQAETSGPAVAPADRATCSGPAAAAGWQAPVAYAGEAPLTFDELVATLATRRVVVLGETHDRFDHHLAQLEIVCRLQRTRRPLAIGLEAFQQPFQPVLDDYVAGRIDESRLLDGTEYYTRWRFDFRHYAPVLRFAREQGIELVALNVPAELTRKVGRGGLESLDADERARLPSHIDRSNPRYQERLRGVFEQHPNHEDRPFEHFLEVQLLWDEGMAEAAARYLGRHPDSLLVIIAGAGHVEYGDGIPARLERRTGYDAATLVLRGEALPSPDSADFRVDTVPIELPPPGLLGIYLETTDDGIEIGGFTDDSAAQAVGMKTGDRLETVDNRPVVNLADVKIAMLEKRPGDVVPVVVRRENEGEGRTKRRFQITLR